MSIVRIIYALCVLIGTFLSYMVLKMLLLYLLEFDLPLPAYFDKSVLSGIGILLVLPVIGFLVYKLRINVFSKGIAYTFVFFWLIAMFFLFRAALAN